jgi:hypothetical protein
MQSAILDPLETAVLAAFIAQEPRLSMPLESLVVSGREFTGAGCITSFLRTTDPLPMSQGPVGLDGRIEIPGVADDLGASIHIEDGRILFLEIVAFAGDWDGSHAGFVVRRDV